jgi:ABC-type lipoprotein release transport system permease subunit
MMLYLRLAWRNLWRHRRRTVIVILSIGLTMGLMMWYDGIVAGFNEAIYAGAIKVLGGNIQIHAAGFSKKGDSAALLPLQDDQTVVETVQSLPQVESASRRILTTGMATDRKGAFGVSIVGIEPEKEAPVNKIAQTVIAGRFLTSSDRDMVYIGKGLATVMDLNVGDRFTVVGRDIHQQTRQRTMTVAGIYNLGMPDLEKGNVYISLAEAQDLYGLTGQSTEVVVMLKQLGQEKAVIQKLIPELPNAEVTSWEVNYTELANALNNKNGIMNIFGVIIMFIAGIGILNLLLMAVFERTREIGMLGALGMKPRGISTLFLLEGALMGVIGVAFGALLGALVNGILGQVGMDYSQYASAASYMALISGKIYPTLGFEQFTLRGITALVISVLASFYPAFVAAHKEPAEALHAV